MISYLRVAGPALAMVDLTAEFPPQDLPPFANFHERLDSLRVLAKTQSELFAKLVIGQGPKGDTLCLAAEELSLGLEGEAFQLDYLHIVRAPKGPWSLYVLGAYTSEI